MHPISAPHYHKQAPPLTIGDRLDNARSSVISILKDTDWPKEASNSVKALVETTEKLLDFDKIPQNETQIPAEVKLLIDLVLTDLESVLMRLTGESLKYGASKSRVRKGLKRLFTLTDQTRCSEVFESCLNDVAESSAALNRRLSNPDAATAQRSSKGDTRRSAKRLLSPQIPLTTNTFPVNTPFGPRGDPVQPTLRPGQSTSVLEVHQIVSGQPGQWNGSSLRGELLNAANKAFKFAEGISGALPVVGTYVGAVAKVGLTLVEMVQVMDDNNEAAGRLGTHLYRVSNVLQKFSKEPRRPEWSQTMDEIDGLQQELRDLEHHIKRFQSQSSIRRFWQSSNQSGCLRNLQERIRAALEEIQLLVNVNTSMLVTELHNESMQKKHRSLLLRLGDGMYGARGDMIEDVTCFPGTRVALLERIDNWIRGESSSERVLWIRGMAGRGKSTVASTVAHNWRGRASCAIYHFRRGQNTPGAPLVCALARQLGRSLDPELKNAILSTVEEKDDIVNQRLDEQFTALFTATLGTLENKGFPILVIVDALDECDSIDYAVNFVKLIDRHSPSLPDNLKFLLTSRPEGSLLRVLEPRKWHIESLDSIDDTDVDIKQFLSHALLEIKKDHVIEGEWPAPEAISNLVRMSQGVFQWAYTVVKYLGKGSPMHRLAELLQSSEVWSGVDELYTQILSKAFEELMQNSAKQNLLLAVLGTLVAAPYPVSLEVLNFLYAENPLMKGKRHETVSNFLRLEILGGLNSLLFIPESSADPIRLMHTSIRDLLADRKRCGQRAYWVNLTEHHQRLAAICISRMNQQLKYSICKIPQLSNSSSENQDIVGHDLSPGIKYSSLSWSIHLTKSKAWTDLALDGRSGQEAEFKLFTEKKALYWLEVMSLLKCTSEAIIVAKRVHYWLLQNKIPRTNSLIILWNDLQRFVSAFSEPISLRPLHIYASALAHCPVETELWKHYGCYAKARTIRGLQPQTWSSNLWTKSVGRKVNSVAFSPDSTLLAAGGEGNAICLLDSQTGGQVGEPLVGHSDAVRSVCFSLDGRVLASGSQDRTIRLWDPRTGEQLGEPLAGHSGTVYSVCFSPNGTLLASGSYDDKIRLWDLQTGGEAGGPLIGHQSAVYSVCFSPDSTLLASGSDDCTIRLWNPHTRREVREPLEGHSDTVWSVNFSPNGNLLASGSEDQTIRLWDIQTGEQVGGPLTGHSFSVRSVSFSPDGTLLASGSHDHTIRLWDPETGRQVGEPLTGHSNTVYSVCFLADSKLLASGSRDNTIRLWDHETDRQVVGPLTSDSSTVCSVCFSLDGKLLAFGLADDTIRLWDPETGSQVGKPLTGHSYSVYSICFSPDGRLLASGSFDNTIRLWNPQTGSQVGTPLQGHEGTVWSVCFSPDGKLLASGSDDKTIRLWDLQTGKQLGEPLVGHSTRVNSVWFSPDGNCIIGRDRYGHSTAWHPLTLRRCGTPSYSPRLATLRYDDHWVTFSSSRVFWLPSQYWGDGGCIVALCEGKLAVAHGRSLSIFDLSGAVGLYNPLFW